MATTIKSNAYMKYFNQSFREAADKLAERNKGGNDDVS